MKYLYRRGCSIRCHGSAAMRLAVNMSWLPGVQFLIAHGDYIAIQHANIMELALNLPDDTIYQFFKALWYIFNNDTFPTRSDVYGL